MTSEVSLGVGGGGCFPGNDTGFPGLASDPTRPDPTPTSEPNFHILSPVRPPFGPSSHWRMLTRHVGRFHILRTCEATSSSPPIMKTLEIRLRSAMILWAVNTSMNLIFSDSFVLFFQCHMMFLAVIKDMSILYPVYRRQRTSTSPATTSVSHSTCRSRRGADGLRASGLGRAASPSRRLAMR